MKKLVILFFLLFSSFFCINQKVVFATVQVSNLDPMLDVRKITNNEFTNYEYRFDNRIEVGDTAGSDSNNEFVGILKESDATVLSKFYANFSGVSNLNWSNLVHDFDSTRGAIYFNSSNNLGFSSLPSVNGFPDIFLRNSATHNINRLSESGYFGRYWGQVLSMDDQNNIAMLFDKRLNQTSPKDVWLYIWNNPDQISEYNIDKKIQVSINLPSSTYIHTALAVQSIGDGKFAVFWRSYANSIEGVPYYGLFYKVIDSDGQVVVDDTDIINSRFPYKGDDLAVSKVSNNKMLVVWDENYNGGDINRDMSSVGQLIDTSGSLVGDWFFVSPPEHYVDESKVDALSDGRYVISWYDSNEDKVYYRIYDPVSMSFSTDPIFIDDYSENDYAGYYQNVAGDDEGGFGVVWGGYFDDGTDYFDRVYFQKYDNSGIPLYQNTEGLLVSDDAENGWYYDTTILKYLNKEFQIVWDTVTQDSSYIYGIAYRKISMNGIKSNIVSIEKSGAAHSPNSPAMSINKDGVPVIIWLTTRRFLNYNQSSFDSRIHGMFRIIPNQDSDRIGICPNATSVNEVNKGCDGLAYLSIGDEGIAWSLDDEEYKYMADGSYIISGYDKGGAFVDGVPAFAFKDFGQGQSTYDNLEVKWYDTGLSGDGTISFYYDSDNAGFDGTAINGTYLESGAANSAILDLSSLPAGDYYLYAVVDDGYYTPFKKYSPQTITKTELVTPTPTVLVTTTLTGTPTNTPITTPTNTLISTPTNTPITTPTSTVVIEPTDEAIPQKVKISEIGLITNVVEKDFVGYYFTSQSPVIKGIAEALNTIHFTYGGKDYTTTSDASGLFTITINNPILPRTTVDLIYYSVNGSGVQSPTRVLRLVIGTENFPEWLAEDLSTGQTGSSQEVVVSITSSPSTSPTKSNEKPSGWSSEVEVLLKDLEGKILINSDILFDRKPMKTDEEGKIKFNELTLGEHKIEFNGEIKIISVVRGQNNFVVYYLNTIVEDARPNVSPIYYILIILAIIATLIMAYKVYKKR